MRVPRTEGKLPSAQETSEEAGKRDALWATSSPSFSVSEAHDRIGLKDRRILWVGAEREREKGELINPSITKYHIAMLKHGLP